MPAKIKDHFPAYRRFLFDKKTIDLPKIGMVKQAKKNNLHGKAGVSYAVIQGDKWFEVEVSVDDRKNFHFRLFANWFDDGPCLRFDSQGRGHCNPESGRGLRRRQILAPHFHCFREKETVEVAYKTARLSEDSECSLIVGDFRLGLEHFCQEARLSCNHSAYPELTIDQDEFDLSNDDPQNGVTF